MKISILKNLPLEGKKVIVRTNYDVPSLEDTSRIEKSLPTIKCLIFKKAKVIIITHWGRPEGRKVPELSLKPLVKIISNFQFPIFNKFSISNFRIKDFYGWKLSEQIILLENLRFWKEEEENNLEFAKKLASLADFYVNEAFACSHRNHASIVGVPKFFPTTKRAFGFDFLKEVAVLRKIREKPRRPVVLILGGVKEDKINYAKKLASWADWILIGGKLVELDGALVLLNHHKIMGDLLKSGQDITMETVKKFTEIIKKAKTIVWAGPMGNFYDKKYENGTKEIAYSVVQSGAFSVVGGGDTEAALSRFGLTDKISFISSGGGAMLKFLAEGTLPGIKAITEKS